MFERNDPGMSAAKEIIDTLKMVHKPIPENMAHR